MQACRRDQVNRNEIVLVTIIANLHLGYNDVNINMNYMFIWTEPPASAQCESNITPILRMTWEESGEFYAKQNWERRRRNSLNRPTPPTNETGELRYNSGTVSYESCNIYIYAMFTSEFNSDEGVKQQSRLATYTVYTQYGVYWRSPKAAPAPGTFNTLQRWQSRFKTIHYTPRT